MGLEFPATDQSVKGKLFFKFSMKISKKNKYLERVMRP